MNPEELLDKVGHADVLRVLMSILNDSTFGLEGGAGGRVTFDLGASVITPGGALEFPLTLNYEGEKRSLTVRMEVSE